MQFQVEINNQQLNLDFNLEYYADVLDLKYIRKALKKVFQERNNSQMYILICTNTTRKTSRQSLPSYQKYYAK